MLAMQWRKVFSCEDNDLTSVLCLNEKGAQPARDGEVECALVNMEELETQSGLLNPVFGKRIFEAKHLLMWSMLHRAVASRKYQTLNLLAPFLNPF